MCVVPNLLPVFSFFFFLRVIHIFFFFVRYCPFLSTQKMFSWVAKDFLGLTIFHSRVSVYAVMNFFEMLDWPLIPSPLPMSPGVLAHIPLFHFWFL